MATKRSTIGVLPVYKGDYVATTSYTYLNRVSLYGCEFQSKVKGANKGNAPATYNESTNVVTFTNTDKWLVTFDGRDTYQAGKRLTAVEEQSAEATSKVNTFEDRIANLEFESNRDFFVAGYTKDGTDAKPVKEYGNKAILKEFYPYLVDTRTTDSEGNATDVISEDGEKIRPVGQLMSNNFLRFVDGRWAPTVAITQEQYDECMTNALYLDNEGEKIYCEAGKYDAEDYFEEIREQLQANPLVENPKKLYKKVNNEYVEVSHYLKPYETVDAHYTIVMGAPHKLYVLDDVEGDSGLIWKGLFLNDTIWDGIDVSGYALEPTGISPCPVTLVTEDGVQKAKCFFYNYKAGGSQNAGTGTTNMFVKDRTYAKTEDMTQLTNVTRARNCNPDKTKPYPFAEGGFCQGQRLSTQ